MLFPTIMEKPLLRILISKSRFCQWRRNLDISRFERRQLSLRQCHHSEKKKLLKNVHTFNCDLLINPQAVKETDVDIYFIG